MTSNQIAYWSLQEQKRSNQIREDIQERDLQNKIADTNSQIKRRDMQNKIDTANTVNNYLSTAAKAINPIAGLFGKGGI